MREAVKKENRMKIKKQYIVLSIIFFISILIISFKLYERYMDSKSNKQIHSYKSVPRGPYKNK